MLNVLPINFDPLRLHELNPERYPYILESVAHGTEQSRFDILFAFPQQSLRLDANKVLTGAHSDSTDFLSALELWFKNERTPDNEDDATQHLPFTGGWFIYLAYEIAQEIEPGLHLPQATDGQTVAFASRCPAAVIRDHELELTYTFTEQDFSHYSQLIDDDIGNVINNTEAETHSAISRTSNTEEAAQNYLSSVEKIHQYIVDGDIFQVNLSREWNVKVDNEHCSTELYRNLRINNPAPFSGMAQLPDMTIISSSPERLVQLKGNTLETRPIAGTRPRSGDILEDQRLSDELLAHPKEQAEHIMLIDLERNDIGRVCIPGSIEVNELMSLESYQYVHHIVSNVKGTIRQGITPVDIIKAVFPGGTITGCPKVRCMEIIAELEQSPRGAYTGSMGYINKDGSMDLNILIRTLVVDKDEISIRAGAGIVHDSIAANELDETRIKARGLLQALCITD